MTDHGFRMEWHRPDDMIPPFETPILAAFPSELGGLTVATVTIHLTDAKGYDKAGEEMLADLKSGAKWNDHRFPLMDGDGYGYENGRTLQLIYSDKIVYWARMPKFPAVTP